MTPQEIEALRNEALKEKVEALRNEALKDKVEALTTMVELLKAERDALRNERDALLIDKKNLLTYVADAEKWFNMHDPNGYVSPKRDTAQQCLREIQAEAGRAGWLACAEFYGLKDTYASKKGIERAANEYAATVRQGGE